MIGTLQADAAGFVIETSQTMSTEPILVIYRYRVNVIIGQPRSESERVTHNGSWWNGYGFQCNTEQSAETVEHREVKRPRGYRTWRDGEWRKH